MRLSKCSNFGGEPADDDRCSTLLHSIALVQGKQIINGNQCVIDTATCQKYPWQPIHSRIAAWLPGKSAVSEAKPVSLMTTYLGESDIKWPTLGRHRHRTVAAGLFTDLVHLWTPAQRANEVGMLSWAPANLSSWTKFQTSLVLWNLHNRERWIDMNWLKIEDPTDWITVYWVY